jgi:hypothetical protein
MYVLENKKATRLPDSSLFCILPFTLSFLSSCRKEITCFAPIALRRSGSDHSAAETYSAAACFFFHKTTGTWA